MSNFFEGVRDAVWQILKTKLLILSLNIQSQEMGNYKIKVQHSMVNVYEYRHNKKLCNYHLYREIFKKLIKLYY